MCVFVRAFYRAVVAGGLLDHECREDLSSNAFGLEHMAAEITAAERDTAADLVQRRDQPAARVASEEADAPAEIHKKDMIKEADEYFIKFHDLKVCFARRCMLLRTCLLACLTF